MIIMVYKFYDKGWDDTAFHIAGVPFIYGQSIGFVWSWEKWYEAHRAESNQKDRN